MTDPDTASLTRPRRCGVGRCPGTGVRLAGFALGAAIGFAHASEASLAKRSGRTTLANPELSYTIPKRGYAQLRRGELEAVIVDNRAVDDEVLPGHRAGLHGIAVLKHAQQPRNVFVPALSGLNFEFIHDGTTRPRDALFEPRHAAMELRVINEHIAELYQPAAPHRQPGTRNALPLPENSDALAARDKLRRAIRQVERFP